MTALAFVGGALLIRAAVALLRRARRVHRSRVTLAGYSARVRR
jgi:hypothetical protein